MITNPIKPLIVKQILIVSTLREYLSRNHIIFTSFIKRQLLLSLNYRILRFQGVTFNHFKFSAKVIGYSLLWLHWNEVQLFVSLCHHFQSGLRCFKPWIFRQAEEGFQSAVKTSQFTSEMTTSQDKQFYFSAS